MNAFSESVSQSTPAALNLLQSQLARVTHVLMTPPQRVVLSEWADSNIFLGLSSPEPGAWRTSRAPYQKEILDVCGAYDTSKVVLMTSAQVGKTSVLLNVAAYHMAHDPCPIMVVQPDKSMADSFSVNKLEPILTESPSLKKLVASKRKRDGGNRKLEKVFPGGFIAMVSSKSAHSLRSRSIRLLLLDEIDAYEHELGNEGDPVKLAEARTKTFPNRKLIYCSTPTTKDFSRIEKEFLASDQRYFQLPCPHCGGLQRLVWGGAEYPYGMKWDDTHSVWYECIHCHERITENHKLQMMLNGQWVKENPTSSTPGFHISALYSPWASWGDLVKEWLSVKDLPDKRQSFFNLALGEPYEDTTNKLDFGELAKNLHEYDAPCPSGVGIILAGIDVQEQWIAGGIWGIGVGEELYFIQDFQCVGTTSQQPVWDELEVVLRSTFKTKNGASVPISLTAVDSGDQTELVYRHVMDFNKKGVRIIPVKGFGGARSVFEWSRYKNPGKPRLALIGVDQAKSILHTRLKGVSTSGPGMIHFPANVPPAVLEEITAEKRVTIYGKGVAPKTIWKKIRDRNEALDCLVYAYGLSQSQQVHQLAPNMIEAVERLSGLAGTSETSTTDSPTAPTPTKNKARFAGLNRRAGNMLGNNPFKIR